MTENTHSTPDIWNVPVDERGTVLKMIPKADYDRLEEQLEALEQKSARQATNIGALYRQRRAVEEQLATLREAAQMVDQCDEGAADGPCGSCLRNLALALDASPAWEWGDPITATMTVTNPATGYRDEDSGVWIDKPGPHARRPSNPASVPSVSEAPGEPGGTE